VLLLLGVAHPCLLSSEGYLLTTFIMTGEIAGVSQKQKHLGGLLSGQLFGQVSLNEQEVIGV
jgi:hypothetical protein